MMGFLNKVSVGVEDLGWRSGRCGTRRYGGWVSSWVQQVDVKSIVTARLPEKIRMSSRYTVQVTSRRS